MKRLNFISCFSIIIDSYFTQHQRLILHRRNKIYIANTIKKGCLQHPFFIVGDKLKKWFVLDFNDLVILFSGLFFMFQQRWQQLYNTY